MCVQTCCSYESHRRDWQHGDTPPSKPSTLSVRICRLRIHINLLIFGHLFKISLLLTLFQIITPEN